MSHSMMAPEPEPGPPPLYTYTGPVYVTADGTAIDCTFTHPKFGEIPFTARATDAVTAPVHAFILENAEATPIAPYVAPAPPPAPSAKSATAKLA